MRAKALAIITAFLAVTVGGTTAAGAAGQPVPATLSALAVDGQTLSGTIILRDPATVVEADPGSLVAEVGGQAATNLTAVKGAALGRTTVLLIDTSGSMGDSGMQTVRTAVASFVRLVPADVKIGVVSFSDAAALRLAPTRDRVQLTKVVAGLRANGETALYGGMSKAVEVLPASGDRSIILLSDGGDTVAPKKQTALRQVLKAMAAKEARAEVIRFKTGETDEATLRAFASAGGGSVANAGDSAAVTAAFEAAARALSSQLSFTGTAPGVFGEQTVVVRGTASGRPFSAQAIVRFPAPAPTQSATATASPQRAESFIGQAPAPFWTWSWWLRSALAAIGIGLFVLVIAMAAPALRSRRSLRVQAIEDYALTGVRRVRTAAAATPGNPNAVAEQFIHFGDRVMAGRNSTTRTMELIDRADLPWRAGEWFVLRIVAVVASAAVGFLLLARAQWFGLIVGGVLGFVVPAVLLRYLARRRAHKFESLLPDVLMLVATSLASGFSLPQAIDAVAKDAAEPAAKEFSRALAETRIGSDLSDALDHLAARMDSDNLRWTTMAIRIQRDVGGNLGETLRTTAKTLRERESLRRQVRALSAEGRLSAYILIALPIAILIYSSLVNYDYVSLLWTTVLGIIMCVVGTVAMLIGIVWMRRVVRIEV